MDQIEFNVQKADGEAAKLPSMWWVVVTGHRPGYDHITAPSAALGGWHGTAIACLRDPKEHLACPTPKDVREGRSLQDRRHAPEPRPPRPGARDRERRNSGRARYASMEPKPEFDPPPPSMRREVHQRYEPYRPVPDQSLLTMDKNIPAPVYTTSGPPHFDFRDPEISTSTIVNHAGTSALMRLCLARNRPPGSGSRLERQGDRR